MLAVGNCCYVAVCSAAQSTSAPTGGGISWRPPAYSLFCQPICIYIKSINYLIKTHISYQNYSYELVMPDQLIADSQQATPTGLLEDGCSGISVTGWMDAPQNTNEQCQNIEEF